LKYLLALGWLFSSWCLGCCGLFQRQIEELIGEDLITAGVRVYMDDIFIFAKTKKQHLASLQKVFERLESFLQKMIEYLDYLISGENIKISSARIQALTNTSAPTYAPKLEDFRELS